MAKKDGGYPLKSPRSRTHGVAAQAIDRVEDGIYIIVAILLVVAGVYFMIPADQLPGFFPGHEAGVTHVHTKHGIELERNMSLRSQGIVLVGAKTGAPCSSIIRPPNPRPPAIS